MIGIKQMDCGGNMDKKDHDIIDKDLYEEIDEEKMYELLKEAREESIRKQKERDGKPKRKKILKWPVWIISIALIINLLAVLPQTISIPAIDFLKTSHKLSKDENIKVYKRAVTVIETEKGRGTGFAISNDGLILTNEHVVEGEEKVTVAFSNEGLFQGKVIETYEAIDLAIVQVETDKSLPHLNLAASASFEKDEPIYFIGNPLNFTGIANEGRIIDSVQLKSWEVPVLMLDAPVYRGNSGSPVINHDGEVIGVVFATLDHEKEGKVGLFIPIDYYYEQQ